MIVYNSVKHTAASILWSHDNHYMRFHCINVWDRYYICIKIKLMHKRLYGIT